MSLKSVPNLDQLDADALRALAAELMGKLEQQTQDIHFKDTHIRKLTHEIAVLRRYRFGKKMKVPDGTGIARALDYSLKRWVALTRYLDDGRLPIDNNWIENQIRPIALGRKNWMFAGSQRAGGPAGGCCHEPDPVGEDEWARSICLSEERARASADASE